MRDGRGRLHVAWRLLLFGLAFIALSALSALLLQWLFGPLREPLSAGVVLTGTVLTLLAVLAASWAMMTWAENVSLAALGLPLDRLVAGELGRGTLLGLIVIGLAVLPLALTGSIAWTPVGGGGGAGAFVLPFVLATTFLLVSALAEEVLLRGYPLQALAESLGGPAAIALTAIAFSLLHALNPGFLPEFGPDFALAQLLPLLNIALAGVLLGLAFWRTYSLWFAGGVHFGWNWGMGLVADLPVSGDTTTPAGALLDTPGFDAVLRGSELWTGGAFGPEGGLVATFALAAGIIWMARTERLSRSLRVRALGPLPDRRERDPVAEAGRAA